MPHRRTVVAAALVLLAWVAAPRTSELLLVAAPSGPASPPTIESKTELLVITSDRPVVSVHAKRSDGQRVPSAMTGVEAGMAASLALAREVRRPGPLIPDEALAFSIAPRGPPLSITA
jgi:hypothetical protein